MHYLIEILDTGNRRVHQITDAPFIEVICRTPDKTDRMAVLLEGTNYDISPAYCVRFYLEEDLICEGSVQSVIPHWEDTERLVFGRYVPFRFFTEVVVERRAALFDGAVTRAYMNQSIDHIVRDAVNRTLGPVHYGIDHTAFPEGAVREYRKFVSRKRPDNELQIDGIEHGQWVGANRIDLTGAFAKDGDTISGIVVDGTPWPDIRLMLIDTEETTRNAHAIKRHPEVAAWTEAQYLTSAYKRRADNAHAALQSLLTTYGIEAIELNPHRDISGAFDDRVDAYGRYLALVYGGGMCFNAAMVELGHADVYLYDSGRYLVPELELKDFFSYGALSTDTIQPVPGYLRHVDLKAGLFESLTALAYAAGGYVWSISSEGTVSFRSADIPNHVFYLDEANLDAALGLEDSDLVNRILFFGNPIEGAFQKTYDQTGSIAEYGARAARLEYYALSRLEDADTLVAGLLNDIAYPTARGHLFFPHGNSQLRVGDIVELRGERVRRYIRRISGEWADRFADRVVGRAASIRYEIAGQHVSTEVQFTSPLRSVESPLTFMVRGQPGPTVLYQFRLDDDGVGTDLGFHLD